MGLKLVDRKATVTVRVTRSRDGSWIHAADLEAFFRRCSRIARAQDSDVTAIAFEVAADEVRLVAKGAA